MRVYDLWDRISILLVTFPPSEGLCSITRSLSPLSPLSSCCPASPDLSALGPRGQQLSAAGQEYRRWSHTGKAGEEGPVLCSAIPQAPLCGPDEPDHGLRATFQMDSSSEPIKWVWQMIMKPTTYRHPHKCHYLKYSNSCYYYVNSCCSSLNSYIS